MKSKFIYALMLVFSAFIVAALFSPTIGLSLAVILPAFPKKGGNSIPKPFRPANITGAGVIARPTQIQKALSIASKFGANADSAQFTERSIYDTLPLDGRTTFNFFEGCNARTFPRTNLSENKLQKQENMIVKYISLEAITYSAANTLPVTAVNPLSTAFGQLYRSDLSFTIANSTVLKPFPMDGMKPEFSPHAQHTAHNILRLGVDLTIPELIEFIATLKTGSYTPSTTVELMIKLVGQATIMSPRASF